MPILYSFRRCPYAMRARMALLASGVVCEMREIVLARKPASMLEASPKGTVPVLVLDDRVIDESLDVMRWALAQHDPEDWLSGADDQLIAENDESFKHHLDRYKYPNRYEDVDAMAHRASACGFLARLEKRLDNGHLGARASMTDVAIFPFVRQFAHVDREWFDAQPYPKLHGWLHGHLNSSRFELCMKKYAEWAPGDAPVSFPPSE